MARKKQSDFIDVKALLSQYLRKWYMFVISVVVCLSLAILFCLAHKPDYAVRANVLISTENNDLTSSMGMLGSLFGSDAYVEDEIFIISSHSLYTDVCRDLGLNKTHMVSDGFLRGYSLAFPEYPIDILPAPGIIDTLSVTVNFKIAVNENGKAQIKAKIKSSTVANVKDVTLPYLINTPYGDFNVVTTDNYPIGTSVKTKISVCSYDSAAEDLDENVSNEIASKRSNVISLAIDTPNPDYGKAILNEIIIKYNERAIAEKNTQSELTSAFLNERINVLGKELAVLEKEIATFNTNKGILNLESEAAYQTEVRGAVENELVKSEMQSEMLRILDDFLKDSQNAYKLIPISTDNQGLATIINEYNSQVLQLNTLATSAREDNPKMIIAKQNIDEARANIQNSIAKTLAMQEAATDELRQRLNVTRTTLREMPNEALEYSQLTRTQKLKAELYIFLLTRNEENAILLANTTPKGLVVDNAYTLSEPLGLTNKAILALALLLGLVLPPCALYGKRLVYNRFENRGEVERITEVPILGEMCVDNSGDRLVAVPGNRSSAAELFALMRSGLQYILTGANEKVVLVTSTQAGEGKSFISTNLAASLAMLGKRVLLVGMDIRNPQLANYLHIAPRYGLTQYLASESIEVDQLITTIPNASNLDVIVAGPIPPNPAELLLSNRLDELFEILRDSYDYIIVDTAPIGQVSDTFTLDRIADAAIYVCRANYTSLSDLTLVNEIHEQHRLKKLSIIVNGTAAKKSYGYHQKGKK